MPAESPAPDLIARELAQLAQSPIAVLRARWRGEFRCDPPPAFGPDLLRRSLAYKLQEEAYGNWHPPPNASSIAWWPSIREKSERTACAAAPHQAGLGVGARLERQKSSRDGARSRL